MAPVDSKLPTDAQPSRVGLLPNPFGKYQIVKVLGRGGMGEVYEAFDPKLQRRVALKVPNMGNLSDELLKRWEREARIAARLDHHHLCRILEWECIDGIHYLAMAYVDGITLAEKAKEGVSMRQAAEWVRKASLGLAVVHRDGVLHRDIKPANIMINQHNEPIVMDFGLARGEKDDDITKAGQYLGTASYMPVEQISREYGPVDARSDIYSLGAVLYVLLCGQAPFIGSFEHILVQRLHAEPPKPSDRCPGIDAAVEDICLRAMAKLPAARYPTMETFAVALEQWLASPAAARDAPNEVGDDGMPPTQALAAPDGSHGETDSMVTPPPQYLPLPSPLPSPPQRAARKWWLVLSLSGVLLAGVFLFLFWNPLATNRRPLAVVPNSPPADPRIEENTNTPPPKNVRPPTAPRVAEAPRVEEAPPTPVDDLEGMAPGEEREFAAMAYCWCPAGQFRQGSPDDEPGRSGDEEAVTIKIPHGYWLGKYEVTQNDWRRVQPTGAAPWLGQKYVREGDDYPAIYVSGNAAREFCARLTEHAHRQREIPATWRFVLPTASQWEYACRAGTTTAYHFGDDAEKLIDYAWYARNAYDQEERFAHPVGEKLPNEWNLHDLHGNVLEWCWDDVLPPPRADNTNAANEPTALRTLPHV